MNKRKLNEIIYGGKTLDQLINEHNSSLSNDDINRSKLTISNIDLSYVDFTDVDLTSIDFIYVNLKSSDFSGSRLNHIFMTNCDLYHALFKDSVIRISSFNCCDMQGSLFKSSMIMNSYVTGSSFKLSSFERANLQNCSFIGCDLTKSKFINSKQIANRFENSILDYAVFFNASIDRSAFFNCMIFNSLFNDAKLSITTKFTGSSITSPIEELIRNDCLDENEYRFGKVLTEPIIGYKRCINTDTISYYYDALKEKTIQICHRNSPESVRMKFQEMEMNSSYWYVRDLISKHYVIATLEIPAGAIVFSINGLKCRTNKAKVIAIDGCDRAYSTRDGNYTSYYVGDEFNVKNFDCRYNIECSTGIHFYTNKDIIE